MVASKVENGVEPVGPGVDLERMFKHPVDHPMWAIQVPIHVGRPFHMVNNLKDNKTGLVYNLKSSIWFNFQ